MGRGFGDAVADGGKRANWGKHRTEVTEVTEGELAFVGERLR